MTHMMFFGGKQAGAIVTLIIEVRSADDVFHIELWSMMHDGFIQFRLTMIASAAIVLQILWIVELMSFDDDVPNANLPGNTLGIESFLVRDTGAVSGDGHGLLTERQVCCLGDDGTIDAATERDSHALHFMEELQQCITFVTNNHYCLSYAR
jgi:hypothetical protein